MSQWPYSPYCTTYIFSLVLSIPLFISQSHRLIKKWGPPNTTKSQVSLAALTVILNYAVICILADYFVVNKILKHAIEPAGGLYFNVAYFILFLGLAVTQLRLLLRIPIKSALLIASSGFAALLCMQIILILVLPFMVSDIQAIYFFR